MPSRPPADMTRTLMFPGDHRPVRLPTYPAVERTAVIPYSSLGSLVVRTGSTRVLIMRQPVAPMWYDHYFATSVATTFAYSYAPTNRGGALEYGTPGETYVNSSAGINATFDKGMVTDLGSPLVEFTTGTVTPDNTWTYPIMATDRTLDGNPFFYAPYNFARVAAGAFTDMSFTAGGYTLELEVWAAPGETARVTYSATATGTSNQLYFSIAQRGWMRPVKLMSDSGQFNAYSVAGLTMLVGCGASSLNPRSTDSTSRYVGWGVLSTGDSYTTMPVAVPSDFEVAVAPWVSTKCTALAANFVNVTKIQNKEGTIMCGRLNPQLIDPWNATAANVAALHPDEKFQLSMEMGVYTYTVPGRDADSFQDYVLPIPVVKNVTSVYSRLPAINLSSTDLVNALFFQDDDGASKMAYSIDWHTEFRTTSTYWETDASVAPLESLHKAMRALALSSYFTPGRKPRPRRAEPTTAAKSGWLVTGPKAEGGAKKKKQKEGGQSAKPKAKKDNSAKATSKPKPKGPTPKKG